VSANGTIKDKGCYVADKLVTAPHLECKKPYVVSAEGDCVMYNLNDNPCKHVGRVAFAATASWTHAHAVWDVWCDIDAGQSALEFPIFALDVPSTPVYVDDSRTPSNSNAKKLKAAGLRYFDVDFVVCEEKISKFTYRNCYIRETPVTRADLLFREHIFRMTIDTEITSPTNEIATVTTRQYERWCKDGLAWPPFCNNKEIEQTRWNIPIPYKGKNSAYTGDYVCDNLVYDSRVPGLRGDNCIN